MVMYFTGTDPPYMQLPAAPPPASRGHTHRTVTATGWAAGASQGGRARAWGATHGGCMRRGWGGAGERGGLRGGTLSGGAAQRAEASTCRGAASRRRRAPAGAAPRVPFSGAAAAAARRWGRAAAVVEQARGGYPPGGSRRWGAQTRHCSRGGGAALDVANRTETLLAGAIFNDNNSYDILSSLTKL